MIISWNPLKHVPQLNGKPAFASAMWLMQDGSILVNLAFSKKLKALKPDKTGSYMNGSWSDAGNFLLEKSAFSSAILSDGRLIACGGEFSGPGLPEHETNFCEVYDPLTQISTQFPPPPHWPHIGDGPTALLNDGTLILGNTQGIGKQLALLNPLDLTWSFGVGDEGNEQGYTLLQTGDVLTTGVFDLTSKRYNPATNAFVPDAELPVMLGTVSGRFGEIGPGMTLMDGRVIWFGASGATCIYTPGTKGNNGTWVQGPYLSDQNGNSCFAIDVPAILESNGNVLVLTKGSLEPVFLEYDPVGNSINVVPPPPVTQKPGLEGSRMLLLPNGHGLVALTTGDWFDVTFSSGGDASWAPTITSFPAIVMANSTVTLTGTQLCGLSECSSYGDDNQQAEHYPVVRFVDIEGHVIYVRTHDVSSRSIAPRAPGKVRVDIPASLVPGTYTAHVVAMGIPSAGVVFSVTPNVHGSSGRVGDMDGDGIDEILVSSPWGIGILKQSGTTMTTLFVAPNGTRLGEWLLNTKTDKFGPVADYDSDGRDEIFVASSWGIGVLRLEGGSLVSISMSPNGTNLGGQTPLNTGTDQFGPLLIPGGGVGLLYSNYDGVTILQFTGVGWLYGSASASYGDTILGPAGVSWTFDLADTFGPIGDFDGDGTTEIVVTSRSRFGVIKVGNGFSALINISNGTMLSGGWRIDTTNNQYYFGGNEFGSASGSEHDGIFVTSPWGIAILWCQPDQTITAASLSQNGMGMGGWVLDTLVDTFGPVWRDEPLNDYRMLVRGPFGIAILGLNAGGSLPGPSWVTTLAVAATGSSVEGWTIDTSNNVFGPIGKYGGTSQEIFVTSPWGIGILEVPGTVITVPMLQPDKSRLGQWLLDTLHDVFGG